MTACAAQCKPTPLVAATGRCARARTARVVQFWIPAALPVFQLVTFGRIGPQGFVDAARAHEVVPGTTPQRQDEAAEIAALLPTRRTVCAPLQPEAAL